MCPADHRTGYCEGPEQRPAEAVPEVAAVYSKELIDKELIDIEDADVTVTAGTYVSDGSTALKPGVTVTLNGQELNPNTDYDVEYSDNIVPGIATVTVTGKGSYCGTAYGEFTVFALLTEAPTDVKVYKTKTELADKVEGKYVIDESACLGCGSCAGVCPAGAISEK